MREMSAKFVKMNFGEFANSLNACYVVHYPKCSVIKFRVEGHKMTAKYAIDGDKYLYRDNELIMHVEKRKAA